MPKTTLTCQWCNSQFEKYYYPGKGKPGEYKYCSLKCKRESQRGPTEMYNCPICGKQCERKVYDADYIKTCRSPECTQEQHRRVKIGVSMPPRSIEYRKQLSDRGKTRTGSKGSNWHGGMPTMICEFCKKEFKLKTHCSRAYQAARRFCSRECHYAWQRSISTRKEHLRVLSRKHNLIHNKAFQRIAEVIRERDHYTCQNCGIEQRQPRLHVHHIIPAHWFAISEQSHTEDNLISLCGKCHIRIEMGILPCPRPATKLAVSLAEAAHLTLWRKVSAFKLIERRSDIHQTLSRVWELVLVCGHTVARQVKYHHGSKGTRSTQVNRLAEDLRSAPKHSRCHECESALLQSI